MTKENSTEKSLTEINCTIMQKIQTGTGCVARRDVHVVESWLDFQFMPKEVDNYRTEMLTVDVDGLAKIVLKEK